MSPLGSRMLSSAVIAAVVAALAVVISPLPATASPTKPPKPPTAAPSKGMDKHGESSEMGDALAKAKKDHKPVEVVGQRGAASTTFANPDGTLSVSLSQRSTRVKQSGEWVPIDTTLAKSKGRWAPKATAHSDLGSSRCPRYEGKISDRSTTDYDRPVNLASSSSVTASRRAVRNVRGGAGLDSTRLLAMWLVRLRNSRAEPCRCSKALPQD